LRRFVAGDPIRRFEWGRDHALTECVGLKALPIELPGSNLPVAIVTLKDRTLTPAVELFLERLRTHVRSLT
jgi:hypothetical protein